MRTTRRRWNAIAIGLLLVGAGCGTDVVVAEDDFEVACFSSKVWSSGPNVTVIPEMTNCTSPSQPSNTDFQSLPKGGYVATDDDGQANVRTNGCGTIYVFDNGSLTTSSCTKSQAGVCVTDTAAWESSCSGELDVETLSSKIELQSTWVGINYVPDLQLTLVSVFQGVAQVTPFTEVSGQLDFGERQLDDEGNLVIAEFEGVEATLGDPEPVGEGFAYFTAPDERLPEIGVIAGFGARQAIPLEFLPEIIEELRIGRLFDMVLQQALRDDIDISILDINAGLDDRTIVMLARGGAFADISIQDALIKAVPWSTIDGFNEPLVAVAGSDGVTNLLVAPEPIEAEQSLVVLEERLVGEVQLVMVGEDPGILEVAGVLAFGNEVFSGLEQLGAPTEIVAFATLEEAQAYFDAVIEEGFPAILIYREG